MDFTTALLAVGSSIGQLGARVWEKELALVVQGLSHRLAEEPRSGC
jgi:hypothetical protein